MGYNLTPSVIFAEEIVVFINDRHNLYEHIKKFLNFREISVQCFVAIIYLQNEKCNYIAIKLFYSNFSGIVAVKQSNAERCKRYRERKRNHPAESKKSTGKTGAQRVREYRERQKLTPSQKLPQ